MPPLITLTTSLKDIQYGKDQKGGGWSGMPFIRFPFPENADTKTRDFYTLNQTNLDFPSRGGIAATDAVGMPLSYRSELDKKLIEKYLANTPRGQMFIQKQIGLQLSNPKMQTSETVPNFKIAELPGSIENTRIWNKGRNLRTQVQVQGTGAHVNRAGILPANPAEKYYAKTMSLENLMTAEELMTTNRLLILQQMKLSKDSAGPGLVGAPSKGPLIANNLGIPVYKDILFEYLGGPGSTYGIGATVIKRYDHTERAVDALDGSKSKPMSSLAMTYDVLMKQQRATMNGKNITKYQDFRSKIGVLDSSGSVIPKTNNVSSQYGNNGAGWKNEDTVQYRFHRANDEFKSITKPGTQEIISTHVGGYRDMINELHHLYTKDKSVDYYNTKGTNRDDLIKFIFECKGNDNVDESVFLFFRAYLGQITDNNQASYNNFRYMGRGENFYVYQGFERSISFSFKIAIGSKVELATTYERLNYLMSQVYPDYSPSTMYMRNSLIKLTIGDYIYQMPGFLDSVNVTIPNDATWEIDEGMQLPQSLDVSIGFKPIFDHLPERSLGSKTNMAIISPNIIDTINNVIDEEAIKDQKFSEKQQDPMNILNDLQREQSMGKDYFSE